MLRGNTKVDGITGDWLSEVNFSIKITVYQFLRRGNRVTQTCTDSRNSTI
jgi:hypothetical protein